MRGNRCVGLFGFCKKMGVPAFFSIAWKKTVNPFFEILDFKENTPIASWE